jgi:hypothetical protein
MNAARLTRKETDAQGDPTLTAEVLADEITDPATGLVSRDHLDMRIAELQGQIGRRFADSQAWMERRLAEQSMATTWRLLGMASCQLVLIGALIKLLNPS